MPVCLPPALGQGCTALVLGSMPGRASLAAGRYYAHPQNRFWATMACVLGQPLPTEYEERIAMLHACGIGLFDVLASCARKGSLDSAIRNACPNDFPALFACHKGISAVFCNGGSAYALYLRHALPLVPHIPAYRLPSTSPANRSLPPDVQLEAWHALAEHVRSAPKPTVW